MKNNKQKNVVKNQRLEDDEYVKPKKKIQTTENKVNPKSKKFWKEIYDDEGEDVEKYVR